MEEHPQNPASLANCDANSRETGKSAQDYWDFMPNMDSAPGNAAGISGAGDEGGQE
jgi:hypothetical protein